MMPHACVAVKEWHARLPGDCTATVRTAVAVWVRRAATWSERQKIHPPVSAPVRSVVPANLACIAGQPSTRAALIRGARRWTVPQMLALKNADAGRSIAPRAPVCFVTLPRARVASRLVFPLRAPK